MKEGNKQPVLFSNATCYAVMPLCVRASVQVKTKAKVGPFIWKIFPTVENTSTG